MIIGSRPQIFDAFGFAQGLVKALDRVVRVYIGTNRSFFTTTGLLLTPRLVLVPGFALRRGNRISGPLLDDPIEVEGFHDGRQSWLERIDASRAADVLAIEGPIPVAETPSTDGMPPHDLVLLRLRRAHRAPGMRFATAAPPAGSRVALLAFHGGRHHAGLSFGQSIGEGLVTLSYDADTEPGSSGAPVFDEQWQLLGVHMVSDRNTARNHGLGRQAVMELLQRSSHWPEIAAHFQLADLAAARRSLATAPPSPSASGPDAALLRAALRLSFSPRSLDEADRERLRRQVVDPQARAWTLQPSVRRQSIRAAGSLAALRPFAPRGGPRSKAAGQRVIAQVLAGAPYALSDRTEQELAWWIQASRWFDGVAPGLPSPAEVDRALQRRRTRSRLADIAGRDFSGRAGELAAMRRWFDHEPRRPLAIWGIGGVGKSALVAQFAAALPAATLLFWLDFDRADLAPDDAPSVIAALARQAAVQVDGLAAPGPVDAADAHWSQAASAWAQALHSAAGDRAMLLVLDSFEVAQHAGRHQELWPVLEALRARLPALRVVVSGRAPVPQLALDGEPALPLPLTGLAPRDARAWLTRNGIAEPGVRDTVVRRSRGLPLVLQLAHRLVAAGGRVDDLPERLRPAMLAGFLYDRILDRVQDPAFKPLAMGALVLRRLTEAMLQPVFGGLVALPPGGPADWFDGLRREAALVEGSEVLTLRHEVRVAALDLLERDQPALVRSIDDSALRWYDEQDTDDVEVAAERVYHRLRLGDPAGAMDAWRDGCGLYLQYAADSLKGAAKRWLRERLGSAPAADAALEVWEHEAAERLRSARLRRLDRSVPGILAERRGRSAGSALVFHEAYEAWRAGDAPAALERLATAAEPPQPPLARERELLNALLLASAGRRADADALLQRWQHCERWDDRRDATLEHAALCAARIRLATDFDAELQWLSELPYGAAAPVAARAWAAPFDVALPRLQQRLAGALGGSPLSIQLPVEPSARDRFLEDLAKAGASQAPGRRALARRLFFADTSSAPDLPEGASDAARRAFGAGLRRWTLLAEPGLFAVLPPQRPGEPLPPLLAAVVGAQALFVALPGLQLTLPGGDARFGRPVDGLLAKAIDRLAGDDGPALPSEWAQWLGLPVDWATQDPHSTENEPFVPSRRQRALLAFAGAPDALTLLVHRFAGHDLPQD